MDVVEEIKEVITRLDEIDNYTEEEIQKVLKGA